MIQMNDYCVAYYIHSVLSIQGDDFMEHKFTQQNMSISQVRVDAATAFLAKVFNWMAIGLGLTALTAYMTVATGLFVWIVGSPLFFVLIFGELGMVIYLSARIRKITAATATALFVGYSVLNGLTLSVIFLAYTTTSIASTFFIAAAMFGAMAVYGYVTKKDLSGLGAFLIMGLFGMIIAALVNLFLGSPMLSWVISGIGVLVFTGLTAYDVQKICVLGAGGIMTQGDAAVRKGAILGALTLYLDFINLFLSLLHFFGDRR